MRDEINDWTMRERLREDLVEHMWARHNATFVIVCDIYICTLLKFLLMMSTIYIKIKIL